MSESQSPIPYPAFDNNNDAFFEAGSPGSKRCPTFKEFADKIKQLQQENFQLRVRIYLGEQKSGVKMSSSDLGFFFPPHQQQQFQQFLQSQSSQSNTSAHSTTTANSETLKLQKEQLSVRVSELENKIHSYELLLKEKQKENVKLMEKNQGIVLQMEELQTEVALAKIELQQQEMPDVMKGSTVSEDEIERGARIAFGHYYDLEEINADLESKLQEEIKKVKALETCIEEKQIQANKLQTENQELNKKLVDFAKTFEGLGKEIAKLNDEKQLYTSTIEEYKLKNEELSKKVTTSVVALEKFSTITKLSGMLQTRVAELVAFIEALLLLESQGVLTITGLTEPNRENLREAVNHTGMLSQSLDEVLGVREGKDIGHRKSFTLTSFFSKECISKSNTIGSGKAAGDFGVCTKPQMLSKSTSSQCTLINTSHEASLTAATNAVAKLKRELSKLEQTKERLTNEKTQLYAKVVSLEANMHALKSCANIEKKSGVREDSAIAALAFDKKLLLDRLQVSEAALTHLHQEHAKLVGELKTLRSNHSVESFPNVPEKLVNNEVLRPSDSNSPDLGIDSGHDGAANSDDSNGNFIKAENRVLRSANRELALRLRQTKQMLDTTMDKLNATTKQKEEVEKTICRQLHKTHTILRNAKKNLENSSSAQCQENIVP